MLVLFDKNVPYQIRRFLLHHEVKTAAELGWSRLLNGNLLDAAEAAHFEVMVTCDQNISRQQNLKSRATALVVLGTNRLSLLEAAPERIVWAVNAAATDSYQFVEYKLPPKQRSK